MKYFDETKFFERELELAVGLLEKNPTNQLQLDRAAYAALKLGDIPTAEKYGASEKLKDLITNAKRRNTSQL